MNLPYHVFRDNVVPFMKTSDVKIYPYLYKDDELWSYFLHRDYNIMDIDTPLNTYKIVKTIHQKTDIQVVQVTTQYCQDFLKYLGYVREGDIYVLQNLNKYQAYNYIQKIIEVNTKEWFPNTDNYNIQYHIAKDSKEMQKFLPSGFGIVGNQVTINRKSVV